MIGKRGVTLGHTQGVGPTQGVGHTQGVTYYSTPGVNINPSFTSGAATSVPVGTATSVGPATSVPLGPRSNLKSSYSQSPNSYDTFSPSSSKTLTIYFNGGALKFKPSMLIPDTKGEDVFFNPTIKYNPKSVYHIPVGQNKKYRYNKFFSSVAFNDQIISDTLRSIGGKQKLLTLKEATRTRVIDYNIYVTLHALFSTNNVLYINKKPYTIYKFNWNEEWQLDTKLSPTFHRAYASETFMRHTKEEEEEANKMLEEVPEEARMSVKMRENLLKSTMTPGVKKPSIKTAATTNVVGTSQNLVNVFTPGAIKNAYKSPYYQIIVAQHKKNPFTISRPFPNHQKRKEKETNPLARVTAASEQNDLSTEFITFTLVNLLYGVGLDETVKQSFPKEEQNAVLKNINTIPIMSETMFRQINKFYSAHHPMMSSKLNEIDVLIDPLKKVLAQNTGKPSFCHLKAPDGAYFWKWLSEPTTNKRNPGLDKLSNATTDLTKKMTRIKELGDAARKIEQQSVDWFKTPSLLTQYFQNIDEIDFIYKSTGDSFREDVTALYDREYLTIMSKVECDAITTATTTTATTTENIPTFNKDHAIPLQQVQQLTTKLKDFVGILQDCAETIRDYMFSLISYISKTKEILGFFLAQIEGDNNVRFLKGEEGEVLKNILLVACKKEMMACESINGNLKHMMTESLFLNNVLFLRYAVSDPLLNENLFIKYSETPGLFDIDFKPLFAYVFESQIFILDIFDEMTVVMDDASEQAHDEIKNMFTQFKEAYIAASNDYERTYSKVDRDAYESSLKLGGTSLLSQGVTPPSDELVEAYQTKTQRANKLQTIITVHPKLSYIHCLKMISLSSSKRDKAAWALSKNAVLEDVVQPGVDKSKSIHNDAMLQQMQPTEKDKYQRDMQEFNITNLRKKCAAIMNQTPGNSCTELQLNVVRPFSQCLTGYTKGEDGGKMQNFYTPPQLPSEDDALLQILCDVLNAHLTSFGSLSTHAFFDKSTSSFNVVYLKAMQGIGANEGDRLRNILIGLKINLIIITKDAGQASYKSTRYVTPQEDNSSVSDSGSDTVSDVSLSAINFTDYIVLFREELAESGGKPIHRVFVPTGGSSVLSAEQVIKTYEMLSENNIFDQSKFNSKFARFVQLGGSSPVVPTSGVVGSSAGGPNVVPASNVVPTSSVVGSSSAPIVPASSVVGSSNTPIVPTSSVVGSSSLSSQLAAMKNIQKMAKNESKLSYYVMIDLVLVPGDKISVMQMANMECKIKADNIQKSLSETFGFAYAPPPLFTDYDTTRHDNHGAPHKNPYSVDERDVSKLLAQHEKELNAVLTESYKKEQDLAMERAMRQVGKNYPPKRGFFS